MLKVEGLNPGHTENVYMIYFRCGHAWTRTLLRGMYQSVESPQFLDGRGKSTEIDAIPIQKTKLSFVEAFFRGSFHGGPLPYEDCPAKEDCPALRG